jgi:hypothetical protein
MAGQDCGPLSGPGHRHAAVSHRELTTVPTTTMTTVGRPDTPPRRAIRRGTFTRVKDLIAAIETFVDGWNQRCEPFVWTKTADEILAKSHRKKTSNTRR